MSGVGSRAAPPGWANPLAFVFCSWFNGTRWFDCSKGLLALAVKGFVPENNREMKVSSVNHHKGCP